jgi:hypothetical protein
MADAYEEISENEIIVAIIVRLNFSSEGYHFLHQIHIHSSLRILASGGRI